MDLVHLEALLMIAIAMTSVILGYFNILLHQKKYAQHILFDAESRKAEQRLLDYPYLYFIGVLGAVILLSSILIALGEGDLQQFLFGLLIAQFSMFSGSLIGGILVFLYAIKNPEKISGQSFFNDKKFLALHAQNLYMPCLVFLIFLSIIDFTPFIFGGLIAAIVLTFGQFLKLLKN